MKILKLTIASLLLLPSLESKAEDSFIDIKDTMCEGGELVYISCSFDIPGRDEKNRHQSALKEISHQI